MFTDENGDFSWKQTFKTIGIGVAIGLATMIPVVGPLVLPALCTYGMLHGGKEVISGISNAMSATTDAEAKAKAEAEAKAKAEAEAKAKAELEVKRESNPKKTNEINNGSNQNIIKTGIMDDNIGELTSDPSVFKDYCDQYNLYIRSLDKAEKAGKFSNNDAVNHVRSVRNAMDHIMDNVTPLEHESIVYRGLSTDTSGEFISTYKNANVGDVITSDSGFQFVGSSKDFCRQYASDVMLEIRLKKGDIVLNRGDINTPAYEGMLPRNTQFKILEKRIDKNGICNMVVEIERPH